MPRRSSRSRPASGPRRSEPTGSASRAIAISWHSNEMVGRRAGLGVTSPPRRGGLSIAYANDSSSAASSCAAAPVHWEWSARAKGVPWIAAGPRSRGSRAGFSRIANLADGRVNGSEGVVLLRGRAKRRSAWYSKKWGGGFLTVVGNRLDDRGLVPQRFGAMNPARAFTRRALRSRRRPPAADAEDGRLDATLVVKAVDPAPENTCDADAGSTRTAGCGSILGGRAFGRLAMANGRRSRTALRGRSFARRHERQKAPWRSRPLGGTLVVRARASTAQATFRQEFRGAGGPAGYWPSTVIVPEAGRWL